MTREKWHPKTRIAGVGRRELGMKDVLKNHDANAITINCLGGFYGVHIHVSAFTNSIMKAWSGLRM